MNDQERLEKINGLLNDYYENIEDEFASLDLAITIIQDHGTWLIQRAEEKQELPTLEWYEINSKKLAELNYFLQERKTGTVGDHVIDVVTDYVKELEQQNKRYEEAIQEIKFQASLVETEDNVIEAIDKALQNR